MKFDVQPFKQCGPLSWGMSPFDVAQHLGLPEKSMRNRAGHRIEFRFGQTASFIFDKSADQLVEVTCSRLPSTLCLGPLDLVAGDSEAVAGALVQLDRGALQGFGSIVFPALGVSLTGYVPEDKEIRAASAFAPGRWEAVVGQMKPFRPST